MNKQNIKDKKEGKMLTCVSFLIIKY